MTQVELAKRSGLNQSTISDLEVGKSQGTTYLATLASALGVNALWLETGRGPRDVEPGHVGAAGEATGFLELKAETAAELRLLSIYRLANDREREAMDDAAERVRKLIEARTRSV